MKSRTKADLQREINNLRGQLHAMQNRHAETHAELMAAREEIEKAEAKGEKSLFARRWQKKLIKALALDKDAPWYDIETAAAARAEECGLFEDSPFTIWDIEKLTELLEGLGISGARLQYALGAADPIAALKTWE